MNISNRCRSAGRSAKQSISPGGFSIVSTRTEAVLVRLAPQLKKNVTDLARDNRRPRVEEIRIALERHVAASKSRSA
jgi:hypothetical protein